MRSFYTFITYLFFPGTLAVLGAYFPYLVYPELDPFVSGHTYLGSALSVYILIPSIGVWFMKSRGWITDFHIYNRRERNLSYPMAILPALFMCVYYFFRRDFGGELFPSLWAGSVALVLCLLWLTNALWLKASAHMAGVGGFLALTLHLFLLPSASISGLWPCLALLLCILVYLARWGLSAHSHKELWVGLCLGFITTFAVFSL